MHRKPAFRRPTNLLFLVGIILFLATASTPVLSAPPEPEPERSYYQPLLLDPGRRIAPAVPDKSPSTTATQAPQAGEGWSTSTYQHLANDNWDIMIREGTGGAEIPVANSGFNEIQPRLRRGADRIAYISDMEDSYQLWTMNPDNTDKRRLTSGAESAYPNWSPDGTRIVFEREVAKDEVEVFVINVDGSGLTQLTFSPGYDGMASWAPDGSHIVFISNRTGGYHIWRMNPDGSNLIELNNMPYSMDPYYSPDGKAIFFDAYDPSGFARVWALRVDSGYTPMIYGKSNVDCIVTGLTADGKGFVVSEINWVLYNNAWYWTEVNLSGVFYQNGDVSRVDDYTHSGLDLYMSWQSRDLQAPNLTLQPLLPESGTPFHLHVRGGDSGGSGLSKYAIQFRESGGPWIDLDGLIPMDMPPREISGTTGMRFEFRIRGEDQAGNLEAWPEIPDVVTQIESQPPHTAFIDPPKYISGGVLYYGAFDFGGSQVASYDVQVFNTDTQGWVWFAEETTYTQIPVNSSTPGSIHTFRVRARDTAGNIEPWPQAGDPGYHTVAVYSSGIYGTAHANTGAPVPGVEVIEPESNLVAHENSDPSGAYFTYLTNTFPVSVKYGKPGYSSLPAKMYNAYGDQPLDLYLPPADNLIMDGDLEQDVADPASPWTVSGEYPITAAVDRMDCHTGTCAALSNPSDRFIPPIEIFPISAGAIDPIASFGNDGSLHFVGNAGLNLYYRQRTPQGDWLAPESIYNETGEITEARDITGDASGAAHLMYVLSNQLFYTRRAPGGGWSTPRVISDETGVFISNAANKLVQIDALGGLHVFWQCNQSEQFTNLCYAHRTPQGSWSEPVRPAEQVPQGLNLSFMVSSTGDVYAAWTPTYGEGMLTTVHRSPDGSWSNTLDLGQTSTHDNLFHLDLDATQRPVVVWYQVDESGGSYLRTRWLQSNGNWSGLQEKFLDRNATGAYSLHWGIDLQGRVHTLYGDYNGYKYAIWPRGGQVAIKPIQSDWSYVNSFYLTQNGRAYVVSQKVIEGAGINVLVDGELVSTIDTRDVLGYEQIPTITLDGEENPHFIFAYYDQINWTLQYFYTTFNLAAEDKTGEISQVVTLPAGMYQAGLSFLYLLGGGQAVGDSGLSAWIENGSGMQKVFQSLPYSRDWEHAWVDLSTYAGQTITLSLRMDQAAGEVQVYGYLDEISLGTGYPDGWLAAAPADRTVPPGKAFDLEIAYGNQGGFALPGAVIEISLPTGLELLDSSLACTGGPPVYFCTLGELAKEAEGSLTLSLRSTLAAPAFQRLDLGLRLATMGTELEMLNNQQTVGITLMNALYLPMIGNWEPGND